MGDFEKKQIENLLKLVKSTADVEKEMELEDTWVLDEKNIIAVMRNSERLKVDAIKFIMVHYRLMGQELIELNRWNQPNYCFKITRSECVLKKLGFFLVPSDSGLRVFDAIYDYKNAKFVIDKGVFDCIGTDNTIANASTMGKNYLEEYNCFLARFTVSSIIDEGDVISYTNPITNDVIQHSFAPAPETYYALINLDGTIRGKRLFMGDSFSKISDIFMIQTRSNITPDMPEDVFESIKLFKQRRIQGLTGIKNVNKNKYQKLLERRGSSTASPYLDEEVAKVISLKYDYHTWD